MLAYTVRRLLQFIPTIIGISLIMFCLLNVLPGNAALMAGGKRELSPELIEKMKKDWGLDKPLYVRYLIYMKDLAHGDLGQSFLRQEKVNDLLASRIWPTLRLAVSAMVIALTIGIPLGFFSALRQGTWGDSASMIVAVSGVAMPQFWLGLLLMLFFSAKMNWFPTSGYGDGDFIHLVLPAITLGLGSMALLARTTRAAVLEVLEEDFIRTARSKGLSRFLINRRHVFQNTLVLILTTAGLQFGSLIGQTVIVEKLFSWPGLGSLLVDSIFLRDIPVVQGGILMIILAFLIVNLVVDLLYCVIDPRIKYQ